MCQQFNGSQPKKEREPVTGHETGNERAILVDALGRPIPLEGDLKVWLDDDLVDRRAPEGWVHLTNVREVCLAILSGRVVELSLDNDLSDDKKYGQGSQVVTFLEDNQGEVGKYLWPKDKLTIHSANIGARDRMTLALESLPRKFGIDVETTNKGSKRSFQFSPPEES